MTKIIIMFFVLQFVNVILNTAKTLVMSRTDSPHLSALVNAITFGFYTAVVKQIAGLDLTITIVITVITNIIGVYVTYWIANKMKKDNLWKVEIYLGNSLALYNALKETNVPLTELAPQIVVMYCYSQEDSEKVKKVLHFYNTAKYNITEITKKF